MYINAKMILIVTVPGIRGEGVGDSGWWDSSMIYLIHCKNLYKCCNVPPPSTTIKIRKREMFLFAVLSRSLFLVKNNLSNKGNMQTM
jgi:hypothetical protein